VCKTSPSNSRKKISFGSPTPCTQAEPCPDVDLLLQARKQADEGELEAALQSCKTSLSKIGPSASAYSLLGLIHRARREKTDAAACFRKALYLDPENEEALMHLLLIAEEDGDQSSAELLQRRLVRQSKGGEA
jgi:chemotaxis protein methyltransferase WspC